MKKKTTPYSYSNWKELPLLILLYCKIWPPYTYGWAQQSDENDPEFTGKIVDVEDEEEGKHIEIKIV